MGKVDLDNGYTRIANELLEEIPQLGFNGTQLSILIVVIRYTYGFQRKEHELSLTFLATATKKHKMHIQKEIKNLMDMNVLIEQAAPTFKSSRIIGLNKDISSWELVKSLTVSEINTVSQDSNTTVSQDTNSTVSQDTNQERKKEIYKERGEVATEKNNYKSVYDHYLSLNLIKHIKYTDTMVKAIKKAMDENKYSTEDCKTLLDRHKQVVEMTKNDGRYAVRVRSLHEFFGQKVKDASHLICTEYDIGGKYYEKYIKPVEQKQNATPFKPTLVYVNEG
mgnify:CR=1 FL=1